MPIKVNIFWKKASIWLLSALLILGCGSMLIGTAYGRYQEKVGHDFTLTVRGANAFQILGSEGEPLSEAQWKVQQDGSRTLEFQVGNDGNAQDAYFSLSLATTLGLQLEDTTVAIKTTNANGQEVTYQGTATPFAEDSVWYYEMGPGNQYHFYDQTNQELCWKLSGG